MRIITVKQQIIKEDSATKKVNEIYLLNLDEKKLCMKLETLYTCNKGCWVRKYSNMYFYVFANYFHFNVGLLIE